jgi:hypothetical protein
MGHDPCANKIKFIKFISLIKVNGRRTKYTGNYNCRNCLREIMYLTCQRIIIIKFVTIFTKTLINNLYNMLQDNTRDWNVEQDLRPN